MPNRINYEPNTVIGSTQILYPDKEKTEELKRSYWICKCLSCGTIRSVRQDNLGRKCKKCGYKNINRKTYDDLTGRVFGNWLVLKQGEKSNYWLCQCQKCGSQREVFRGNLTQGSSQSCGCMKSRGEEKIVELLKSLGCIYEREYTFIDLVGKNNHKLPFDFAIFSNITKNNLISLLEFDGEQHYRYKKSTWITKEKFSYIQRNDKIKNQYCYNNNIKLIRIPYWDYDKLNEEYLMRLIYGQSNN